MIHTREAEDDTLRILAEEGQGRLRGVFHCFTGDSGRGRPRAGDRILPVDSRRRHVSQGRSAARRPRPRCPADRLLVETDSPYLAPVPYRGKRNEPAYVARVVEQLAAVRGTQRAEAVGEQTDRQLRRACSGRESPRKRSVRFKAIKRAASRLR